MMRSEKRGRGSSSSSPSGRPPKRRRRRAGFFYKLFMMLLLIVLWPFGLLMLWQRKLRWNVGTKLLTSVVTLFACVVLFGFALTADTGNPTYTQIQDSVNSFLDEAADWMVETGNVVGEKAKFVYESAGEFGDSLWVFGREVLANGIDEGVQLANSVKDKFAKPAAETDAPTTETTDEPSIKPAATASASPKASKAPAKTPAVSAAPTDEASAAPEDEASNTPAPEATLKVELPVVVSLPDLTAGDSTEEPAEEPTDAPTEEPTAAPTEEPTDAPTDEPTGEPTDAPTEAPTDEPTNAPTDEPTVKPAVSADDALPVYIPQAAPNASAGKPIAEGILNTDGTLEAAALSGEEANAASNLYRLKPAALATVYFNSNGKTYHYTTKCGKMNRAEEHVLGDAAETRHQRCTLCETPDKSILDESYIVWLDEDNIAHMSDECADFEGRWTLQTVAQANEDGRSGCTTCGADAYLAAVMNGEDIQLTWDEGSFAGEAAVPAAGSITPEIALKPAAQATVYHSSNGKWYHTFTRCQNMTGGKAYALEDCVDGFKTCTKCGAPSPDFIGKPCLWQDESKLCHTTDECADFKGQYTLILRDDALAQEMSGCTLCGADQYLIKGTSVHYLETSVG